MPPLMIRPTAKPSAGYVQRPSDYAWERRCRPIVHLIFGIYWLLIFENVLRKWIFPEWSNALFFIRDPLVVLAYCLALKNKVLPEHSVFYIAGILLGGTSALLVLVQFAYAAPGFSWLLVGYGWRNYFFYIPLSFLIARCFTLQDIQGLIRRTLIATVPIAGLVYWQFASPATALVNAGSGGAYDNPGVAMGYVRTYGTFTSSAAQTVFIASIVAMLLAQWLGSGRRRLRQRRWLIVVTPAVVTCVALCGSRWAVIWSGLVLLSGIGALLLTPGFRLVFRWIVILSILIPLAVVGVATFFPAAVDSFTARWVSANALETETYQYGVWGRTIDILNFRFLLPDAPITGYGMGTGSNAVGLAGGKGGPFEEVRNRISIAGPEQLKAVENDWGRQILDLGPILGMAFIVYRVAFVAWLGRESIRATRRSFDPLPVLTFAFVGILLFNGQITSNGTLNGYSWLFAGFLMAINQSLLQRASGGRWVSELRLPPGRRLSPLTRANRDS